MAASTVISDQRTDVVSDYLSERHRADRANGCAIAALGPEMVRQGEDMRRGVTTHVRAQLDRFSQCSGSKPARARNRDPRRHHRRPDARPGSRGSLPLRRDSYRGARRFLAKRNRRARAIIGSHDRGDLYASSCLTA